MSFFKKKKEIKIENTNVNSVPTEKQNTIEERIEPLEKIEVIEPSKKIETTIKKKSDFTFLILVFGTVIIFVLCMPILQKILSPTKRVLIKNVKEEYVEDKLEHGYVVIDKNTYKTIENIKFFDFKHYENNMIVFSYTPNKNIRNAYSFNIYIEIVNTEGIILLKKDFDIKEKINKDAVYSYSIEMSEDLYKESYYVKIEVIEPKNYTKTLVCASENKNDTLKTSNEITYTFLDNSLVAYEFNQKYQVLSEKADISSYSKKYLEQYNLLKKTNIKETDISYSESKIYYKIDFSYFNLGNLEFKTRYNKNEYYDIIKIKEKNKGWTCE